MKFPSDFIEKVRGANNISEIIGQYTQLTGVGTDLKGLCPFPDHNEKTASFSVSESKQVYHCFGCKKGGNLFTFLQTYNGMSFPEAIEYLAQRAQIPLPKLEDDGGRGDERLRRKKLFLQINKFAMESFQNLLLGQAKNTTLTEYLKRRGISEEIRKTFHIGYSTDSWDALVSACTNKKFPLQYVEELGLVKKRKSGDGYFDIFRDRLIFPILSPSNEVLGFGGRIMGDGQPKYLNSPESQIFHKGRTLYGLHETAKYIRSENYVIVVEGYMDLIALYGKGIKNVVANLGTAFTEEHAKLLKRYSKNVFILFDGDSAGKKASLRALPILLANGLSPKTLSLPDSMDPDDYLQKYGVEKLKKLLGKAPEMYVWYLNGLLKNYSGQATEKVDIVDKISPILTKVADPRLKKLYFDYSYESLGVSSDWLKNSIRYYLKNGKTFADTNMAHTSSSEQIDKDLRVDEKHSDSNKIDLASSSIEELELVRLAVVSKAVLDSDVFLKSLPLLRHEGVKEILQFLLSEYRQNAENFAKLAAQAASKLKDPEAITEVLDQEKYNEDDTALKLLNACVARIQRNFTKMQLKSLQTKSSNIDVAEHAKQVLEVMKKHKSVDL